MLAEIGAAGIPQMIVCKIDITAASSGLLQAGCGNISAVRLNAKTGEGLPLLRYALVDFSQAHRLSDVSKPESRMAADRYDGTVILNFSIPDSDAATRCCANLTELFHCDNRYFDVA